MSAGLLLDSHALLWWQEDHARLSVRARRAIEQSGVQACFSAASVWELAIKQAKEKLRVPDELLGALASEGFVELQVTSAHATVAGALPLHHRDPFDRMLVAQAQVEKLTLVTGDARISAYDVPVLW